MVSVCRRTNNWLVQNNQVGSGGGTGQALCRWTQNGPQILGTISFAACGTHWVGSTASENRNAIAHWFCIFNGVAAVHGMITYPISSLSSLFFPLYENHHHERRFGVSSSSRGIMECLSYGVVSDQTFTGSWLTQSATCKSRVLCWPCAWEQPRECATGKGRRKSQMTVHGITHGGQSTGNPPETMDNAHCPAFLECNEKMHFCW